MLDRRELARAAQAVRTKPKKRISLAGQKNEGGSYVATTQKGNMINSTGNEAGGAEVTAGSITQFFMFFFLAIMVLHLFTKNMPQYRSANPFKKPVVPTEVTESVAEPVEAPIQSLMQNVTVEENMQA